ncbi:MAG: porin family protein [Bacteroidetes bacterium]|nr:porin family protein [Bacteroidota bacterium]
MKKTITSSLILILAVAPCILFSQASHPMKLGLKVAPNIGWMSPGTKGYTNDGARVGATVGFVSDFYFAENYALSTGFNFQFLNGKLRYSDSLMVEGSAGLQDGEVFRKYNFLYLEIPVMIKMQTKKFGKLSYFGQIGIGTGFRIKTTVKEHFELTKGGAVDQQYDFNGGTTLIRESILVGIGCEYHLDESSRIMFGISYSNGLNNILTGENYKSNLVEKSLLNYVEVNIGFLF